MGKVVFNMSVSLDGFVAGPNDEVDRLFGWYFSGDTELHFPGAPRAFKVSPASARHIQKASQSVGVVVTGRRTFNLAGGWGGNPPLGVHHFVLTHHPPQEWIGEGSPFTFVTGGIESAIRQAKAAAGDKDVAISSAQTMQQCIRAGLLDEIYLDLVPILLGNGIRLFENLGAAPVELEAINVIEGQGVTHLGFRVLK